MANPKEHKLALAGNLGLRDATQILEQLRAAFAQSAKISIDTQDLTGIDITILQLLVSAHKTALADGKALSVRTPQGGALNKALLRAGFVDASGLPTAPGDSFWSFADQNGSAAA